MGFHRPAYLQPLDVIFINAAYGAAQPYYVGIGQFKLLHTRRTVNAGNSAAFVKSAPARQLI